MRGVLVHLLLLGATMAHGAEAVCYDAEGPLSDWLPLGGSGERARDGDIARSDRHAVSGRHALRFTVSQQSQVVKGTRAELTCDRVKGLAAPATTVGSC